MRSAPASDNGLTLLEVLVGIALAGIVVSVALPSFVKVRDRSLEAEVKSNVHTIQIAIERYATDDGGFYPSYIFGGDVESWTNGTGHHGASDPRVRDPLLRYGYLRTYPLNPFLTQKSRLCPLANADPRFGCRSAPAPCSAVKPCGGDLIGNALSDPNFPGPDTDGGTLSPNGKPCPGMTTPNCAWYFIGDDDPKTVDFIPGEFFYRTFSLSADLRRISAIRGHAPPPAGSSDDYIMGGYGSVRTPGEDLLHCWSATGTTAGWSEMTGHMGALTYFYNPQPGFAKADDGCSRRGADAFASSSLWQNEPASGGKCTGSSGSPPVSNCLGGLDSELPNILFTPAIGGGPWLNVTVANHDGRPDGIVIWVASFFH